MGIVVSAPPNRPLSGEALPSLLDYLASLPTVKK
jgi:hypothetical protein